jgi:aflatoxin B1 aldehyde reductase
VGFEPDQLQAFLDVASKHNRVKPTVYQGEYNILTRGLEKKILPLLRANGVSYYAHCPLAAGFLTGKFTNDRHAGTRFATDHPLHKVFHDRYDVPALHEAVKTLERVGESRGISVRDASLRWIFYHSALRGDDGVITGCTTLEQIRENAESVARGSLPDDMVKVAEEIWNALSASRGDLL